MIFVTPKQLAYASIVMGIIVLLSTIAVVLFPQRFAKWDQFFSYKKKEIGRKTSLALFINSAITPLTVSLFYGIIGLALLYFKEYKIFGIGGSSIILASLGFRSVKRITQRKRPENAKIHFKDFSFPSGHTTAGFVFFLSVALAFSRLLGFEFHEIAFALALLGGGIVARSRWYLHVHWLSDVIVGALLGTGCFLFSYLLFFYFGDAIFKAVEEVFFSL